MSSAVSYHIASYNYIIVSAYYLCSYMDWPLAMYDIKSKAPCVTVLAKTKSYHWKSSLQISTIRTQSLFKKTFS